MPHISDSEGFLRSNINPGKLPKLLKRFAQAKSNTFAGCSEDSNSTVTEMPDNPNNPGNDDDDNDDDSGTVIPGNGKILIAWFTRWGNTNYPSDVDASTGTSIIINKGAQRGTTEMVARYIQTYVGGDLHLIETSNPIPNGV